MLQEDVADVATPHSGTEARGLKMKPNWSDHIGMHRDAQHHLGAMRALPA
jgi:hypothetical protein